MTGLHPGRFSGYESGAMRRPALPRLGRTAGAFAAAALCLSAAGAARAQDADAQLNAVYHEVMPVLSAPRQSQLRAAERAWIAFRDKNGEAFLAAERAPGMVSDDRRSETLARCGQLRQMVSSPPPLPRETLRARLGAADSALNAVYQQCLARLDREAQGRLREAQRAWIAFRDENARANSESDPRGQALAASLQVTLRRTSQINGFYLGGDPAVSNRPAASLPPRASPLAAPPAEEPPDPSIPDPFASAR